MYPNQLITAKKVCKSLQLNPYCMLVAEMQSGKTGTYLEVALTSISSGHYEHVIIFSGANSTSLGEQLHNDLKKAIEAFSKRLTLRNESLVFPKQKKDYCERQIIHFTNKIKIIWGHPVIKKLSTPKQNTLLIHDESHYAQDIKNIVYKFMYKRHGIEKCLHGDNSQLREKQLSLLSVSATPISEAISHLKYPSEKSVIFATPGEGYRGIKYRTEQNKIRYTAKPITLSNLPYIADLIEQNKDPFEDKKKYFVFRGRSNTRELFSELGHLTDCCVIYINQDSIDTLDIFKIEPEHNTIVVFYAMARMGDVISKEHIAMGYEYYSKATNADAMLQGLFGRFNGYYTTETPVMYVPEHVRCHIETYYHTISNQSIEGFCKHKKAKNVSPNRKSFICYDKDQQQWVKTIPFCIRNRPSLSQLNHELIQRNYKPVNVVHVRNSTCDTYVMDNVMTRFKEAIATQSRFSHNFTNVITDHNTIDIIDAHQVFGSTNEGYMVYGFEMYDEIVHRDIKLPIINDECIFKYRTHLDDVVEGVNGGNMSYFPEETASNRDLFTKCMRESIIRSLNKDSLINPRCISSLYCHETQQTVGIRINRDESQSVSSFLRTLRTQMLDEFGVELHLKYRAKYTEYRLLDDITW